MICDYGCGRPATTFKTYSKRWCCETSQNKCPGVKRKQHTDEVIQARKDGVRRKYGVENISQAQVVKDKKIATCLKNHGVEYPQQSKEIRAKSVQVNLERYGFENVHQVPLIIQRAKNTCLERYGVDNASKAETVRQQISDLKRAMSPEEVQKASSRRVETCIARYGVPNVSQNEDIHYSKLKTSFSKQYIFPSGKVVTVQGYEPKVLDDLIKAGIKEDDIRVGRGEVPTISYSYEGKVCRYFPDIYIVSHNWIVEVKSLYTFQREREKNMAKRVATKTSGYSFSFAIR